MLTIMPVAETKGKAKKKRNEGRCAKNNHQKRKC